MTELVDAPAHSPGLNYVGGAWVPSASGERYSKARRAAIEFYTETVTVYVEA